MRYGSVCSGIEAATVAWHPLGWQPAFFSEIDRFPCEVLAQHYGSNLPGEDLARNGVPNLGDMTKFQEWPDHAIDLLVGGTPCQSFSVAGLRAGLADPRGNLMLTYLAIAARYRPRWLVWENVPGVISSFTGPEPPSDLAEGQGWESVEVSDFGCLLAGLSELGYGFAYRVIDAQYVRVDGFEHAVPQRRRRVFVVGYLGDWRRAAAVFFDGASLRGDPAPRREAGKISAPHAGESAAFGGGNTSGSIDVAAALAAHAAHGRRQDFEVETFVAHALRGDGFDASEDGTGRGTPIVPVVAASLTRGAESSGKGGYAGRRQEDDTNLVVQPIPIDMRQASRGATMTNNRQEGQSGGAPGTGIGEPGDPAPTIASSHVPAVAFDMRGREDGAQFEGPHETANIRAAAGGSSRSYIAEEWAVRRLTPLECERLQGFPDGYTAIPRAKDKIAADGPRYKALGNSMAVNAMRWIGERIAMVDAIEDIDEAAA